MSSNEYVQDALDLIEFANGPVTSPWGKLRAQMGHPAPFHLEMIGVGNEQWGPRYVERYKVFAEALKAKHPEIKLVVAPGPLRRESRSIPCGPTGGNSSRTIVDEHYYMSPGVVPDEHGALRPLRPVGAEGLRGRICRADRRHDERGQSQQLEGRDCRGGIHDRPGAQWRRGADGLVCAAAGACGRVAVDAGRDLV